ncbi:MAG: dipeptidase PepE [Candidatus Dormibacteraeota bacterium]|nr:dipeptidase PepE [Candidatus Dormibacteraeota bacterium]
MNDVGAHLGGARRAVFLPFARADHAEYAALMAERMEHIDVTMVSAHAAPVPAVAVEESDAILVGGGNTFRLLRALRQYALLDVIRARVAAGVPYFGASAGSNVACPTIRTTNDMPIVETRTFDALNLVPFQINPHYVDPPPPELRAGETRVERLREFLEENDVTVIGLREPSWVVVKDDRMTLHGAGGAVLFQRGREPESLSSGSDVSALLAAPARFDRAG